MATAKKPTKPKKPSKDFPLTAHASKRWCKKIGQKMYYFGTWGNPEAALREYLSIKESLQAGIDPRKLSTTGVTTVGELVNLWLDQKNANLTAKDISPRSFQDYQDVGKLVVKAFGRHTPIAGLRPENFANLRNDVASRYAPSRFSKIVTIVRMIFKWGFESDTMASPMKFGPNFKGASKNQTRKTRNATVKRFFTAAEIKTLVDSARQPLKAMILLGINCGLGNTDVANIRDEHIQNGWLMMARAKTAIERRIPLWPETLEAIDDAKQLSRKANSPSGEGLLFLTRNGGLWTEFGNDELAKQFNKLLKASELYQARRTFYALRHTFQTIGDEAKDPVATSAIMGHADNSMAAMYREQIGDDRLKAVTDHVRKWYLSSLVKPTDESACFVGIG